MMRDQYISYNLHYQHHEIESLIKDLNNEQLNNKIIRGKWAIKDNIAHLARYQEIFEERVSKMYNKQNIKIKKYVAENDPGFSFWQRMEVNEIIDQLFFQRQKIIDQYDNLYKISKSYCIHPTYGRISIKQLFLFFIYHESHHLFTIYKLKRLILNETEL